MLHTYRWKQQNETHQALLVKGGRGAWDYNGGWTFFKYTVYMYGIVTMKPPHITDLCSFKNIIKKIFKEGRKSWGTSENSVFPINEHGKGHRNAKSG
jgi:hypothetical protein